MRRQLTTRIGAALAVLVLVFVGWAWWSSLLPSSYTAMEMGYPDFGGGPEFAHGAHTEAVDTSPKKFVFADDRNVKFTFATDAPALTPPKDRRSTSISS